MRTPLLEARAEPLIAEAVLERNEQASQLLQPDFTAMRRPHPKLSGRLWTGLVVEAALLEHKAGRRQPQVRAALAQFLVP